MSNNIQTVNIPGKGEATITITGVTNAAYIQNVIVEVISSSSKSPQTGQFNGTGEDVPFKGHFSLTDVPLPATVKFTFSYSKDGGSTYFPAHGTEQKTEKIGPVINTYTVTSEDSEDNDDNDTVMELSIHSYQ